ncbi:MAG: UTP--glucose-1-phosphate uridylyltransferase, partial [Deltaproteobacteria bacterium]|nr:UTP--glucose-1-phosphate uridylyltransferase [Deltaproteobacteria bacterium]
VTRGYEFLLEVTAKTAADVKGGTLIRRGGRLALLELAQVAPEHGDDFQDLERFPVFNTNSLWIDLQAVRRRLADESLGLPLIVNRKSVQGVAVVQLETAMGAAVEAFHPAAGVLVPRSRFAPVKTTDDLLVRRSDAFVEGAVSPLVPNPKRDPALPPPVVRLDPRFFSSVADLDLRIPSAPSLLEAEALEVVGDVRFGRGVTVRGNVRVENRAAEPLRVPDGALLAG